MSKKPSYTQVAWTAGRIAARQLLSAKESDKDVELGDLLTAQRDQMKGLGMKLGQIVSYMDVPLPPSVRQQMARLQKGISGISESETREVLSRALGQDFERLFDEIDFKPVAAASIGQVHRARHLNMPPPYLWVARLQWGLWSLLSRLGAHVNLQDIYQELLTAPICPLDAE